LPGVSLVAIDRCQRVPSLAQLETGVAQSDILGALSSRSARLAPTGAPF
jgi:hypothetical protein